MLLFFFLTKTWKIHSFDSNDIFPSSLYPLRVFCAYCTAPGFVITEVYTAIWCMGSGKLIHPGRWGEWWEMIPCGPVQFMLLYAASGSTAAAMGSQIKDGWWMPELYYTCETQAYIFMILYTLHFIFFNIFLDQKWVSIYFCVWLCNFTWNCNTWKWTDQVFLSSIGCIGHGGEKRKT